METEGARIRTVFRLRSVRIALVVIAILMAIFSLPIWHHHGDIGGLMHGHPIWDGGHIH